MSVEQSLNNLIASTNSLNTTVATTQANIANQLASSTQGFNNTLSVPAVALPYEVTAITGGIGTGTGGINGTYSGGVTGGPAGFRWHYTIANNTLASYVIDNPGIDPTNAVPTLSLPSGGLTGATVPTAVVSTIPVNRIFKAPDSTGNYNLSWINGAGALASYPVGGTQYLEYLKSGVDAVVASTGASTYETTIAYGTFMILDAGGRIIAQTPDPLVTSLLASAAASTIYETTDTTNASLYILDAGGRIISTMGGVSNSANVTSVFYETTDTSSSLYILDAGGGIVTSIGNNGVSSEIISARGNLTSLSSRLDPSITADGAPIQNPYRPQLLRHSRYRLTKLSLPTPETVLMGICACGDSYTHNASRWVNAFTDKIITKYGDGGMGFTSFGFLQSGNVAPWIVGNQPTYLNGNARPTKYVCRLYGNIVGTYYTDKGPDLAMATFSQSGDAAEIDFPTSHPNTIAKLLYVATAGASARYTTNGGSSWVALDLSIGTAGTVNVVNITPPSGAATMRIEWVSGTCPISGVFARGTTGVYVSKIAATGSNISHFSGASATNWETGITALEPNLFAYMDGTNSQGASFSASNWGSYLSNIVGRTRAAIPGIDILIATPPENQRTTNSVPMAIYPPEARKRAMALRFTYTDMQDVFGDPTNPTEYGYTGAIPLFASDLIHPDPQTGGRSLTSQFLNAIIPYGGA